MKRDDHLNSIAKSFGRLSHEIRALNAIGRFDINSVAEDFLIAIIKVAFACPDLRNQNEIQMNFPAVDLGCRTTRVSFQITTDASSSKAEKTLNKFHEHSLEKLFDRIYILSITEKQSSYKAEALARAIADLAIPFDPTKHIIDLTDLLSQIRILDTNDLQKIDIYLASGWAERDKHELFRAQIDKFLQFSTDKIEFEKRSRKYIPSIFVETHSTKEETRLFANPLFFYRKIQDGLNRFSYDHLNSRMTIAKEPIFTLDLDVSLLTETPSNFAELEDWLARLGEAIAHELAKVRPLSWRREGGEEPYHPINGSTAEWSIARFQIQSSASDLTERLQSAVSQIGLIRKKIFLVTSMAGQGKTNFVCDLIENQFRSFAIPSLFVPARDLNMYPSGKLLFEYIAHNRYSPNATKIHEYLKLFNDAALELNKPFLIVIDGINEVTHLTTFSDELKAFCNAVCQYEMVKVIITCRSEFFEVRYASMLDEPFAVNIHRVSDLRSEMSDRSKTRLLRSYFNHFNIRGELYHVADEFLKTDLLLLRIFCERYEGDDIGYMTDIYKGDLFEDYLQKKIMSFPQHLQSRALPTLYRIITEMLDTGDFIRLSVRSFATEEQAVIQRFIEDDVILWQEIASEGLAALGDLAISFTYDELRDFVIAYKLIVGDAGGVSNLKATLGTLLGRPIYEGVVRYAYLLARKIKDASAIAACESDPNFIEHYSLNVHLLPPATQVKGDIDLVRSLLSNSSEPKRLRRTVSFLVHRRVITEMLNITILCDHLNGLEAKEHATFISAVFGHSHDYEKYAWRKRIDEFIQNVIEEGPGRKLERYGPEWLAFFLHATSLAGWSGRERVSTLFRDAMTVSTFRDAVALIRSARAERMHNLLTDIEDGVEAEQ